MNALSEVPAIAPYVADNGKIVPPKLASYLQRETPTAVNGWGVLYAYRDGVYRPAAKYFEQRIHALAGDSWSRHLAAEVVGNIRAGSQPLDDAPHVDRINLANGTFNVASGELEKHDSAFLSPVQLPVSYLPGAKCPLIERFLVDTLDDDVAGLFVELAGYLLTADNRQQRAFMLMGPGGSGKTTALEVLGALLGDDNVSRVALQQLDEHRFAVAQLFGKLANIHADLPSRAVNGTSMFKSITGGDKVMAERKGCHPFEFRAYARFVFSANETPPTHDGTEAYFDRWTILPFTRSFRGATGQDRNLVAKLTTPTELSGLLNLALASLADVRRRGFSAGTNVVAAHDRFRLESDPVAAFLDERARVDFLGGRTQKSELYGAYVDWCRDSGRKPLAVQRFTQRIRERLTGQVQEVTVQGTRFWDGIELLDAERRTFGVAA